MNPWQDVIKPASACVGCLICAAVLWWLATTWPVAGGEAGKAEAEQLLGEARDLCRVASKRGNNKDEAQSALARTEPELVGMYYRVVPVIQPLDAATVRLQAIPVGDFGPTGYLDFNWQTGESHISWD
jgi:hypothetical protein